MFKYQRQITKAILLTLILSVSSLAQAASSARLVVTGRVVANTCPVPTTLAWELKNINGNTEKQKINLGNCSPSATPKMVMTVTGEQAKGNANAFKNVANAGAAKNMAIYLKHNNKTLKPGELNKISLQKQPKGAVPFTIEYVSTDKKPEKGIVTSVVHFTYDYL